MLAVLLNCSVWNHWIPGGNEGEWDGGGGHEIGRSESEQGEVSPQVQVDI